MKNSINNIKLEYENLGKPKNPEIVPNPTKADDLIPQAWEYNKVWYYNWKGALAETNFLNKKMPSKTQWEEITKSFGNNGVKLSEELNLPFDGTRNRFTGNYDFKYTDGYYWSSDNNDSHSSYYLTFNNRSINPRSYGNLASGFSVRCIKK